MRDFSILKTNFRNSLVRTLVTINSTEKILDYQRQVPFVVLSYELFAQWNTTNYPKNNSWFKEEFSENERMLFEKFNALFEAFMHTTDKETLRDVDLLVNNPQWQQIQIEAGKLLENIS